MSIKDSLIEKYYNQGGEDPGVVESTTLLVKEVCKDCDSGGSGGVLVVEFVYDSSSQTYTSTMLAADVIDAYYAGTPVMCHFPSDEEGAPSDMMKAVTWIARPGEGASGITSFGFDSGEEYMTYSGIEDGHIVCSLYIDRRVSGR